MPPTTYGTVNYSVISFIGLNLQAENGSSETLHMAFKAPHLMNGEKGIKLQVFLLQIIKPQNTV